MKVCEYYGSFCGYQYCSLQLNKLIQKYEACCLNGDCDKCILYQNKKNILDYNKLFSVGNLVCLKKNGKREWKEISFDGEFENFYNDDLINKNDFFVFVECILEFDKNNKQYKIIYDRYKNMFDKELLNNWDFGKFVRVRNNKGNLEKMTEDFFIVNKNMNCVFLQHGNQFKLDTLIEDTNKFIKILKDESYKNDINKNGEIFGYIEKIYQDVDGFKDCKWIEEDLIKIKNEKCENLNILEKGKERLNIKWEINLE